MQACGSPFNFLLLGAEVSLVALLELVSSRVQAVAARRSRGPCSTGPRVVSCTVRELAVNARRTGMKSKKSQAMAVAQGEGSSPSC